jgi:hypothetical protein
MHIHKIQEIVFDANETLVTATVANAQELVILMQSENVFRYNIDTNNTAFEFSLKSVFTYSDGGFDTTSPCTIYTLDSTIVVTNNYKTHIIINCPSGHYHLRLQRKDYNADISCFPIALFKNNEEIPHIIYGADWNHVQIMNLDTRQILTAAKSLIKVNAEENHLAFYKEYQENNKLAWPNPYDYFFGKLHMSPNGKRFLSAGWVWGSRDFYTVYSVDTFINSNRITDLPLDAWEHENRAVCWIDDETVAVTYNPYTEDVEGATKDSPSEIHFYQLDENDSQIKKVKIIDLNIAGLEMCYSKKLNILVAFSDTIGIAALSLDGKILFHDPQLKISSYFTTENYLLSIAGNTVSIYQLIL